MATETVAVIGAGAAGLVTARELDRAGFDVTVFEQSGQPGGVWVYSPDTEDDQPGAPPVFSSLYDSLRTNLPRDLMPYTDYTFDSAGGGGDGWPRYPHHTAVLAYLRNFAADFGIARRVRFRHRVDAVRPVPRNAFLVSVSDVDRGTAGQQLRFDAVAICNGHYSRPRVPSLPGIGHFHGRVSHSHNYRDPEPFRHKTVALWGTAASGADISIEIARVASKVFWCGNAFARSQAGSLLPTGGAIAYPSPTHFDAAGRLCFEGDHSLDIDDFMFCTGYRYDFPFLSDDIVRVDDNWVHPLYLDLLSPDHPTLAFVGLPYLIVPFPLFEMQARWFARVLQGRVPLPERQDMHAAIEAHRQEMMSGGIRQRHFHKLGERQTTYYNLLAAQCGEPPLPAWFSELATEAQQSRLADPAGFRDKPLSSRGPTRIRHSHE